MNTKYVIKFQTLSDPETGITSDDIEVRLQNETWAGGVTTLKGGADPFMLRYQSGDGNVLEPIRASEATITYVNTGDYPVTLFENATTTTDDIWRVEVYNVTLDAFVWFGWLVQDDCREAFMPSPTIVTLTATDSLGLLKTKEFTNLSGVKVYQKLALSVYLEICLRKTGLDLPVYIYNNVFENGHDDRSVDTAFEPFSQTKVNSKTFIKDNETFEDCYSVLEKILSAWDCTLFQQDGRWNIVRFPEAKDFDNEIPGTLYQNADFTNPVGVTSLPTFTIGRTQSIKNAGGQTSSRRPLEYSKLIFNYEQPLKLILNDDLSRLGALRSTSTVGVIKTDLYEVEDWTYENPSTPTFYIVVKTNTVTGIEVDRYMVMPFKNTATSYVQSNSIEVNQSDRFVCSVRFRTATDINDNINFRFGFLLDGTTNNYTLTNVGGVLRWNNIGAGTTANTLTQTVLSTDDSSDWKSMDVFYGITNDDAIPAIPEDGLLYLQIRGFNSSNVSDPAQDTWIKDIQFTYYTYINDSTRVSGQYHLSTYNPRKNNLIETRYLDDSPKNNLRGVMFLDDGVTKTSVWHRNTTVQSLRFGFIQDADIMHLHKNPRVKLEGTFKGIKEGGEYIGLRTIFELEDLPGRYFITGEVSYNYKTTVWNATLIELWADDDSATTSDTSFANSFGYLYGDKASGSGGGGMISGSGVGAPGANAGAIIIPRPMIEYREFGVGWPVGTGLSFGGNMNDGVNPTYMQQRKITLHFLPSDSEWLNHEPAIFLFRYKKNRKTGLINFQKKGRAWVHPNDHLMEDGRWSLEKHLSGMQATSSLTPTEIQRRTEWLLGEGLNDVAFTNSIPAEKQPYYRKELALNLAMYRRSAAGIDDMGTFPIAITTVDAFNSAIKLTGWRNKKKSGETARPKTTYFRFAYGVRNPAWTAGNGEAPILFGDFSDILCVYLKRKGTNYIGLSCRIGHSFSHVN